MTTNLKWPIKDVAEKLDYAINWTERLGEGEVIAASVFAVIAGGVVTSLSNFTTTHSIVWLESGTAGQTARLSCQITTNLNRVFKEVVSIPIVNRAA